MYRKEVKITFAMVDELKEKYLDVDKFIKFCHKCGDYGNLWSCPPFDFTVEEFLDGYQGLWLIASKILIDEDVREETITKESMQEISTSVMNEVKDTMDRKVLALEKETPDSKMLSSGSCHLCAKCERPLGMPCRYPGRLRHSLEAVGFDVTAISEEVLGIPLQWMKDKLPEYFTRVNGLLVKEAEAKHPLIYDEGEERFFYRSCQEEL